MPVSERVIPDPRSPWWGEHRSRYRFAACYAAGRRVLDVACGSGFGVAMLAQAGATFVVGVDIDDECVLYARSAYGGSKQWFVVADGAQLPFPEATFDLVTSFETLEHVRDSDRFVAEIRRVLRMDGWLLLSTPNRAFTEINGHVCENPFHIREFYPEDLAQLLGEYFTSVLLLGQKVAPEYRVVPFEAYQRRLYRRPFDRLRVMLWRLQNKLPFNIKDYLSCKLYGHPFYPAEEHYLFCEGNLDLAPTLVAVCRP